MVTLAVVQYNVDLPNPILHIKTKHIKKNHHHYIEIYIYNDIKDIYVPTQEQDKQFYELLRKFIFQFLRNQYKFMVLISYWHNVVGCEGGCKT